MIPASGTRPATTLVLSGSPSEVTNSAGSNAPVSTHVTGSDTEAVSNHGLSSGAIAGIVVALVLLIIGLFIVVLRRRTIAKRDERRSKWHGDAEGIIGTDSVASNSSAAGGSGNATDGSGYHSTRSSFATNFDHGLQFRSNSPVYSPDFGVNALSTAALEFPPMAEVRNGPLVNTTRFSSSSNTSSPGSNSAHSQYLDMPVEPPEAMSPMSVRPFSASEGFFFPKPPPAAGTEIDWLNRSHPDSPIGQSAHTLTPKKATADRNSANMSINDKAFPAPMLPNPFSDDNDVSSPFSDPSRLSAAPDAPTQVICRPFAPTLEDEVAVIPGDAVRIVKTFDDGWAYIEKVQTLAKGLIPIDCFRQAGEDLPAFLASKRVSSFYNESDLPAFSNAI